MSVGTVPASNSLTILKIAAPFRRNVDILLLIAFPFVLMLLTRAWTFYAPSGDVDTYVYTAFFLQLDKYLHVFPDTYYGSRLPWNLMGNTAYWFLSVNMANLFLRFFLFYVTIFSVYLTIRLAWRERFSAVLAALLVGVNVYFHSSISWDYVDGPGLASIALILACVAGGATTKWSWEFYVAAGFAIMTAVSTQIALLLVLPSVGVWYLALWYLNRRYSFFAGIAAIALGMAAAFAFYGAISYHITGKFNYLRPQIDFAQRDAENPYIAPISSWINTAGWLVFPVTSYFTAAAFVVIGFFQAVRGKTVKAVDRGVFAMASMGIANLGLGAIFAYNQVGRSTALLQFRFYADYLIPFAFLTIGGALALALLNASKRQRLWIAAAASILILAPYLIGAFRIASQPLDQCDVCKMESTASYYAVGSALIVVVSFVWRKAALVLVALAAFAFMNPGTSPQFEAMYFGNTSLAHDRFLMVYDANKAIKPHDADGQLLIWFDSTEPLGLVYNGTAGLHLWGYRILSMTFPKYSQEAAKPLLVPGRRIAILTAKPGALQLAEQEMKPVGLHLELIEHRTLRRGGDAFDTYVVEMVPGDIDSQTVVDLASAKGLAGAKLERNGTGFEVTTPSLRWSYSALLAVPEEVKRAHGESRAFIRIEGMGLKGSAGVGVLRGDRSSWVANAGVRSDKHQPYDIYIPIARLADTSDIVVFNWDRDEVAQVRVTRVTIYIFAS